MKKILLILFLFLTSLVSAQTIKNVDILHPVTQKVIAIAHKESEFVKKIDSVAKVYYLDRLLLNYNYSDGTVKQCLIVKGRKSIQHSI